MNNAIVKLREYMKERGIDAWYVNSSDYHDSEYPGEYFKLRSFLTGFTGSAGDLVVMNDEAGLWTDGRYFVQAASQLEGSGVTLYKIGEKDVPTVSEFLLEKLPEGGCLGFDGKTVGWKFYKSLKDKLEKKKICFEYNEDLGDKVWDQRPGLPCNDIWFLDEKKYSGKSVADKLNIVREKMDSKGTNMHIITSLDDIAWLFNIRGSDIACNPVAMSYAVITTKKAFLFVNDKAASSEVRNILSEYGVEIKSYDDIYDFIENIEKDFTILLDSERVNCAIYSRINKEIKIVDSVNPETILKAVKNDTEQDNMRKAHIKDGVAVVKFIYWLKNNIGKTVITEMSAANYIDNMRSMQEGYIDLSFNTISAYGSNAAMCHYSATKETDTVLKPEGFLLVDSGGQYLEGTTDITRTIVLGKVTDSEKLHYTLVLKGMINLACAKFKYGCTGANLDILTRAPLWQYGLDFNHGTGHGIGYLLNVHEGPNRIHWNGARGACIMEPGMITSDEPGFYLEGKYGIRTENLILCKDYINNEYGRILEFETLTMVPIDKEAIDISLMTKEEKEWLNNYHKKVYEALSIYLSEEEKEWLKIQCSDI